MTTAAVWAAGFKPGVAYRHRQVGYRLLPFTFESFDATCYIATTMAGEYQFLDRAHLEALVHHTLTADDPLYATLAAKHFLVDGTSDVALDLVATKLRTRYADLFAGASLHIIVVTLRCEHSCPYCQVSRVSSDRQAYDLGSSGVQRVVDLVFSSPAPALKIEFQGGEPLLNWDGIQAIVTTAEHRAAIDGRPLSFVIATNLALITDEHLAFCREHRIGISTSLDGPRDLHTRNRPRPGGDSYDRVIAGINRCRAALGHDQVAALMTTTRASLDQPEAIIAEYVNQGFTTIFLRSLSPFGFAVRSQQMIGYDTAAWCQFYERGLRTILALNYGGTPFREEYASIILRKILTPFATGYVDLRSPAGLGLGAMVYNYDGTIYPSDEARMLAATGDQTFRLGHIDTHSWRDLIESPALRTWIDQSMTEATPSCSACPYEPFCGTDPVFHHATQGDLVGHRPTSAFCQRNMFVIKLLLRLLEDDPLARPVLESWAHG